MKRHLLVAVLLGLAVVVMSSPAAFGQGSGKPTGGTQCFINGKYVFVPSGGCPSGGGHSRPGVNQPNQPPPDNSAAIAAAAEAERRRVEAERQRQREIEAQRKRDEEEAKRKQQEFERKKQEALSSLKGVGGSELGLKGVGADDLGLKDLGDTGGGLGLKNAPNSPSPHKGIERQYRYTGNGLIAGTSWSLYASRKPGEPEQRMCDAIKHQAKLARSSYDLGVDCTRYQFVLGMAASLDWSTDLKSRVVFDELTNGQFSANEQSLYDKLRGKQFDELGCHSNGAMICLAALENEDIKAEHVVLYGPQVTRESLEMWDKLVRFRRVKSVKVYINENDIVPGVSIAFADLKETQAHQVVGAAVSPGGYGAAKVIEEAPLFEIDSLKRTINETSPRLLVETFPCARDRLSFECHAMSMYKSKVNCTGKSSGKAVPGTALHGKDELPEPPMPCEAIGSKP
jgi:hypothetical protein